MKKTFLASLVLLLSTFLICGPVNALKYSFLGGELVSELLFDAMSISLADSADSIYLGTIASSLHIGIGNETSLFFPVNKNLSAGPHFIFDYNTFRSSWHAFENFQTRLGGIIDYNLGMDSRISAYLDYNLGWFTAEQVISSVSGSPAPAGAFAGGLPGIILGVKAYKMFSDTLGIGGHFEIGSLTLTGIKYKNNSGQNAWMDASVSFSQAGVNIYF